MSVVLIYCNRKLMNFDCLIIFFEKGEGKILSFAGFWKEGFLGFSCYCILKQNGTIRFGLVSFFSRRGVSLVNGMLQVHFDAKWIV